LRLKKLAIIHFNTFEFYPPVLNIISDLISKQKSINLSIFSTFSYSSFNQIKYDGVNIYRFGINSTNRLSRYFTYVIFNLFSTLFLIFKRPDFILVYETLSVFPAFIYSRIFCASKVHIHFHEYTSLIEKTNASIYMKMLFKCEKYLLETCSCSHTNEDRKNLFLKDNPNFVSSNVDVYPNLPPSNWWYKYGIFKNKNFGNRIKLVHVGALDFDTMYLKEIISWVKLNPDTLELTLFSQNLSKKTRDRILKLNSKNIFLRKPINYFSLPQELIKYDVGLVLYKGLISNHIFSVPNKVFEYLSCGLHVIVDQKLVTTTKLGIEQIWVVDFAALDIDLLKWRILNLCIKKPNFYRFPKLFDKL
jgi:hypothetical protein